MYFKEIFKLTRGELFKLFKSKSLHIMAGVLILVIGLFTILFGNMPEGVPKALDFNTIFSKSTPTVYEIYDLGVKDAITKIDKATGTNFTSDEHLVRLIKNPNHINIVSYSPTVKVLPQVAAANSVVATAISNFSKEMMDFVLYDSSFYSLFDKATGSVISESDLMLLVRNEKLREEILRPQNKVALAAILGLSLATAETNSTDLIYATALQVGTEDTNLNYILNQYYSDNLSGNKAKLDAIEREMKYFRDSGFTKSYVDYITEVSLPNFIDTYRAFALSYDTYIADMNNEANFQDLNNKFVDFRTATSIFYSDVDASLTSYKLLHYEVDNGQVNMQTPPEYAALKKPLSELVTVLNNVTKSAKLYQIEQSRHRELLRLYPAVASLNVAYTPSISDSENLNRLDFVQQLGNLYSTPRTEGKIFDKAIFDYKNTTKPNEEQLAYMYKAVRASKAQAVSEKFYNEHLQPYEAKISGLQQLYVQIDSDTVYSELQKNDDTFYSTTNTLRTLVNNINLKNIVDEQNFNDERVKNLYGMIFSSRYTMNSNITQAKFILDNNLRGIDYAGVSSLEGGWEYMNFVFNVAYLLIMIYAIVIASGMVAGEYADGTMKLLLIRPYTKTQVLLSKIMAIIVCTIGFTIIAYVSTLVIGLIGWGAGSKQVLSIFNATTPLILSQLSVMTIVYSLALVETVIYALISLMVSTIFKSRSGAVSISMLIYFSAQILSLILSQYSWYKFVLFNNTNFYQYFGVGPALNDMNFFFSLVVTGIYLVGILVSSFAVFKKRDAA